LSIVSFRSLFITHSCRFGTADPTAQATFKKSARGEDRRAPVRLTMESTSLRRRCRRRLALSSAVIGK